MNCIKERFDQPGFRKYVVLQEMFLNELRGACSIYSGDIDKYSLEAQLPVKFELKKFAVSDLIKSL